MTFLNSRVSKVFSDANLEQNEAIQLRMSLCTNSRVGFVKTCHMVNMAALRMCHDIACSTVENFVERTSNRHGMTLAGFAKNMRDSRESVDMCLHEICQQYPHILEKVSSPWVRLSLLWGSNVMVTLKKKKVILEMLPVYDLSRIKSFIPFNIGLLGARRSGKSIASFKLTEYLLPSFDLVISFLGTKNCNRDLCNLIATNFDERLNFVEFSPQVLSKLIEQQERLIEMGTPREVLIVFDDVFAANQRHVEILTQLFIRGRHYRISIINCAVCFTTVQKNCRRCLDVLFLYSSVCKSDNQILSSEYIHRNISTANYALQNLEPYRALVIETKRNQRLFEFKFELGWTHDVLLVCSGDHKNKIVPLKMNNLHTQEMVSEDENSSV